LIILWFSLILFSDGGEVGAVGCAVGVELKLDRRWGA